MKRHFAISFAFLCMCAFCASVFADAPSQLIPESDANAAGLTRAWFAQATLMRGHEEVTSATLQDGLVLTTTENSRLQAFDAETGVSLWCVDCGDGYLLPPAVNSKLVAALCGTKLLVYDRHNGKLLSQTELYGDPSSGPVMSEREIYVPLFSQRIMSYPIVQVKEKTDTVTDTLSTMKEAANNLGSASDYWAKKFKDYDAQASAGQYIIEDLDKKQPNSCASFGFSLVPPVMGTQSYEVDVVGWTSSQGWLMLGETLRRTADDPFRLLYKLQARPNFSFVDSSRISNKALIPRDDVQARPFFVSEDKSFQNMRKDEDKRKGGMFIVGAESGHVYAMNDMTGELRWTYLTRSGVSERISAFDDQAYIPTASGDLFAVELKTGVEAWKATGVTKTIAASQARLYTMDSVGRMVIVDRENGNREKIMKVGQTKFQIFNQETDRLYFVTADGLIQCLHETQLAEPIRHRESCADINARIMAQLYKDKPGAKDKDAAAIPAADTTEEPAATTPAASASKDEDDDPFAEGSDDSASESDDSAASSDDEDDPFGDSSDAGESESSSDDSSSNEEEDPFGGDF